jgi:hypothetical protein
MSGVNILAPVEWRRACRRRRSRSPCWWEGSARGATSRCSRSASETVQPLLLPSTRCGTRLPGRPPPPWRLTPGVASGPSRCRMGACHVRRRPGVGPISVPATAPRSTACGTVPGTRSHRQRPASSRAGPRIAKTLATEGSAHSATRRRRVTPVARTASPDRPTSSGAARVSPAGVLHAQRRGVEAPGFPSRRGRSAALIAAQGRPPPHASAPRPGCVHDSAHRSARRRALHAARVSGRRR